MVRAPRSLLSQNGVKLDHLQTLPGKSAYTNIEITESGDRIFAFEDFGVCQDYRPNDTDFAALLTMDHVHIGWIADEGATRRRLAAAGISVSQDISVNNDPVHLGIDGLRIAFGSAGEDRERAETLMKLLLAKGAKLAVVTRGSEGSAATDGNEWAETGITPVDIVDTTGGRRQLHRRFSACVYRRKRTSSLHRLRPRQCGPHLHPRWRFSAGTAPALRPADHAAKEPVRRVRLFSSSRCQ